MREGGGRAANLFGRRCQRFRWGGFGFVREGKCSEVLGQNNLLDGGAINGLGKTGAEAGGGGTLRGLGSDG